jgi:hypothetical protein
MKPITSILFLALLASSAAAQTVTVGGGSAECGQNTSVPVLIDSVSGLLALEFSVAYDPARVTPGAVTAGTLTSGFSVSSNAAGGVLSVAMASGTAVSGAGTVANIAFTVSNNATGNVPLTISDVLVNDVARGGNSGTLSVSCNPAPDSPVPIAPANRAVNVASPVTLRWQAAADATSYRLHFGITSPPPQLVVTDATTHQVQTQPGTTYFWRLYAINSAGATAGPTFSFTTSGVACSAPAAPQVTVPAEGTSGVEFDVSWAAVTGATQYIVEESASSTFANATETSVSSTRFPVTHHVTTETTFWYRVRARNAAGSCNADGPASAAVSVRVGPRPSLAAGTRVLPVAGSTSGSLGSFFRTALQLHNPTAAPIRGRLVFHPQGVAGSGGDPSLPYSLAAGETASYIDVIAALGLTQTIGSLDLVAEAGPPPATVMRVFNDAGAAGTTGMVLEQLDTQDAIRAGQRGVLIAPLNPARARMNIGIRTLLDGAALTITVRDRLGATIFSSQRSYPPTYFVQLPLSEFTGGAVLLGDEVIVIAVDSGSAIAYGATTDNITQDPEVQIARPVE